MSMTNCWMNALVASSLLGVACQSTPTEETPKAAKQAPAPAAKAAPASPNLGFVVSSWYDDLPEVEETHCPGGFNPTESEFYEVDMQAFRASIKEIGYREAQAKHFPPDACQNPTAQKDPGFKTFDGAVVLAGLDLDGVDSKSGDGSACAHDDFVGPNGEKGIDSQHWRLMGCIRGYQRDAQIDRSYRSGNFIKEGFPMLIEVSGVDDLRNDDEIEVRIHSSADSVTMDADGRIMRDLSLRVHEDPRYTSPPARGKIVDGVLTSEPVDLRIRFKQQVIDGEFYYRDARMRAEIQPDGMMSGILGFYWDAENFYKLNNDHYIGENHTGRVAAETRGYMCAGIYHAIERVADGHPDPETGKCTSISGAMHFEGTPAFVIQREATAAAPAEQPVS